MFNWRKLGLIFDPRQHRDATWMHEFAQSPSVLIHDDHIRIYFCSRPPPAPDGQYVSLLSYVDVDRSDLLRVINICREPVLSLGKYGTFDEFGTNPISVIRDQDAVRVYYAGWTRCESVPFNAAIGVAVSDDGGNSFHRLGDGPVLSYSHDEPFLLGSPRVRRFDGKWQLWYVSGKQWLRSEGRPEPVYKIRMATSADGVNWVKHGKDLIEDRIGEHECQACADVTYHRGAYHMFFSYRDSHNYKNGKGGYRIGYARSEDMINWSRRDDVAGLTTSEHGWDSEMVSYPHVFAIDDHFYMLYQGNGMGRSGIGIARLDGATDWGGR